MFPFRFFFQVIELEFSIMFRVSMAKIIPDHYAIIHPESNALELSNVSDRISGTGDSAKP